MVGLNPLEKYSTQVNKILLGTYCVTDSYTMNSRDTVGLQRRTMHIPRNENNTHKKRQLLLIESKYPTVLSTIEYKHFITKFELSIAIFLK